MAEPVRGGDETVAANAETVAAPDLAAPAPGDLAWSGDEIQAEPAADRQSWSATWRKAGALLIGGLALAGAIIIGFWVFGPSDKGANKGAQPPAGASRNSAPPAPSASPSAASPASIASTPEQDNSYVQALNDRGISFANPEAAIYNGKMVCQDVRQGMTIPQIVDAFRASNPALGSDADAYVAISVRAYCPQNNNLVSGIS